MELSQTVKKKQEFIFEIEIVYNLVDIKSVELISTRQMHNNTDSITNDAN